MSTRWERRGSRNFKAHPPSSCLFFSFLPSFHFSCPRHIKSRAKCTTASQMCLYLSPSPIVLSQPFFLSQISSFFQSETSPNSFLRGLCWQRERVANGRRRPLSLLVQSLDGRKGTDLAPFLTCPTRAIPDFSLHSLAIRF